MTLTIPERNNSEDHIRRCSALQTAWRMAVLTDLPHHMISVVAGIDVKVAKGIVSLRKRIVAKAAPSDGLTQEELLKTVNLLLSAPIHKIASTEGEQTMVEIIRTRLACSQNYTTH